MNHEEKLRHLDEMPASLDSAATTGRSKFFWLQITAALVTGGVLSVGTVLLLQKMAVFTDLNSQQGLNRPLAVAPAVQAPTPAPPPVLASADMNATGATVALASTEMPQPPGMRASANPTTPPAPPITVVPATSTAPLQAPPLTPGGATAAVPSQPSLPLQAPGQAAIVVAGSAPQAPLSARVQATAPATVTPSGSADRLASMDRQMVEHLAAAVEVLTLKVAELEKSSMKKAKVANATKQLLKAAVTDKVSTPYSRRDELALPIFAISATGVLVSDNGKTRLVAPGEKLPGGMTFLNFDPHNRRMKTDQGEYAIPALPQ